MSALDQAFIKAYSQYPTSSLPQPSVRDATRTEQASVGQHAAEASNGSVSIPGTGYRVDQPVSGSALQPPHARFARTGNTLRSRYTAPPPAEAWLPPPPVPAPVQEYPELLPLPGRRKPLGLSQLARQLVGNAPAPIVEDDMTLSAQEYVPLAATGAKAAAPVALQPLVQDEPDHQADEEAYEESISPSTSNQNSQLLLSLSETFGLVVPQMLVESVDTTALHSTTPVAASKADDFAHVLDTFSSVELPTTARQKQNRRFDAAAPARGPHFATKPLDDESTEVAEEKPEIVPAPPIAAWEVDLLEWPEVIDKLTSQPDSYFVQAGKKLTDAVRDGLKILGVAASQRGEGGTTVALSLARIAARCGVDVAIVDANFSNPQVAECLQVEIPNGWELATKQDVDLSEVTIHAVQDRLKIYSLQTRSGLSLENPAVHSVLKAIAARHALTIIDLGPVPAGDVALLPQGQSVALDAVVVVRDVLRTPLKHVQQVATRLHASGIAAVAIAENFVS